VGLRRMVEMTEGGFPTTRVAAATVQKIQVARARNAAKDAMAESNRLAATEIRSVPGICEV
jgi:hypothetical protein